MRIIVWLLNVWFMQGGLLLPLLMRLPISQNWFGVGDIHSTHTYYFRIYDVTASIIRLSYSISYLSTNTALRCPTFGFH